jgi:hypothetical protein
MTPSDRQQVADLHQAIRRAQWEVVGLRLNEADPTTLAAKTQRLAELRDRLHKVMAATRPATCPLVDCPAPGGRCGWGCCLGQGAGAGRRANCPWRQPTGSPPK